jgi:benzodiazapine receptor
VSEIASKGQLRASYFRWAVVLVPLVLLLGFLSSSLAPSGSENAWYQALAKPNVRPPDIAFPIVWTVLYALMGLALAMVANARGSRGRGIAVALFAAQLLANLVWTPLFFGAHQVTLGFWWILLILALAIATTFAFTRVRRAAAWLMVPYLGWLCIAAALNWQIDRLNPNAETLAPDSTSTQILL